MGNTWNYELIFEETRQFSPEFFRQILDLAGKHGYTLHDPTYVIDGNGDDIQFHNAEDLTAYMCSEGGIFAIWRDELDIQVGFYPSFRHLSIGVHYNLRENRDEQIVNDLEAVFSTFCENLQPYFGYSHDEWNLETISPTLFLYKNFEEGVAKKEPPKILFWLNYFEANYFESLGEWRFEKIAFHKLVKTEHGVFVYLASAPWNIRQAILGSDGKYYFAE